MENETVSQEDLASNNPSEDPFVGLVLADKYQIQASLGGGGAGQVYKAKHLFINRIVAIKVLFPHLAMREDKVQRFKQEALAMSHLSHPNITAVLDFGQADKGQPYLVMEYVQGVNLDDYIQENGPLSVERALPLLIEAADALAHAHSKGLIHRDLKPSNIMLVTTPEGKESIKLIDFGLAKHFSEEEGFLRLTQTGEVFGSPYYMSPEQVRGQKVDFRTDVYSMGIVIYETLIGHPPFMGDEAHEVFSKQLSETPGNLAEVYAAPQERERLEYIILKSMAKHPADRHQTMAELRDELALVTQSQGTLKRTGTLWNVLLLRGKGLITASGKYLWISAAALTALAATFALLMYIFVVPHGKQVDLDKVANWQTAKKVSLTDTSETGQLDFMAKFLLEKVAREHGTNSAAYANALNKQAMLYMQTGRYSQAVDAFKKILKIRQALPGFEGLETAMVSINLGSAYYNIGEYSQAQPLFEQGITTARRLLSQPSADLALPLSQLADIYRRQKQIQPAIDYYRQALDIWRAQGQYQSSDCLSAGNQLADLYYSQGQLEPARILYSDLTNEWQKFPQPQAQNAAVCLDRLAGIAEKQNQLQTAEQWYRQELTLIQKLNPSNTHYQAAVLSKLSSVLWKKGQWPESISLRMQANSLLAKAAG